MRCRPSMPRRAIRGTALRQGDSPLSRAAGIAQQGSGQTRERPSNGPSSSSIIRRPGGWCSTRIDDIVAYWHVAPLKADDYGRLIAGRFKAGMVTYDRLTLFENKGGHYNLFFVITVVNNAHRNAALYRQLFFSFFDVLEKLAAAEPPVFITEVAADVWTPEGIKLAEGFGMKRVGRRTDDAKISPSIRWRSPMSSATSSPRSASRICANAMRRPASCSIGRPGAISGRAQRSSRTTCAHLSRRHRQRINRAKNRLQNPRQPASGRMSMPLRAGMSVFSRRTIPGAIPGRRCPPRALFPLSLPRSIIRRGRCASSKVLAAAARRTWCRA